MKTLFLDTEDNSPELLKTTNEAFHKRTTQIAAMTDDGGTYHNRGDIPAFLKWLKSHGKCFVYAHNLQYDLGNLFRHEMDCLDVTMVGGRMIKARWNQATFYDSHNLFPMPLRVLGKAFGLEKGQLDTESKEYVMRDVEIVREAVQSLQGFAAEYGVTLPATVGGLAVKIWKSLGGENWTDTSEFSHESLFGGRVEIFSNGGEGRIVYTDVNSLYPSAMLGKFPDAMENHGNTLPEFGAAEVEIDIPAMDIAPLPFRREDGAILFPCGKLRGVWTIPEIKFAVESGAKIKRVIRAFGSKTGTANYAPFISKFYSERLKTTSEAHKLFFKLLMNNLYGQLAVGGEITR